MLSIRKWVVLEVWVFLGGIMQSWEHMLVRLNIIFLSQSCRYWWVTFSIWGWIYTESKLSLSIRSLLISSVIAVLSLRGSNRRTKLSADNLDFGVWIRSLQYTCLLFVFWATSFSLFLQQFLLPLEPLSWWTHYLRLLVTIPYIWFRWLFTANRWWASPQIYPIPCRPNTSQTRRTRSQTLLIATPVFSGFKAINWASQAAALLKSRWLTLAVSASTWD